MFRSTLIHRRVLVATVGAAIAASGAAVVVAPPALADAQSCAGNVCMGVTGNGGGTVYVTDWAYAQTFTGHFTLTGPQGVDQVSTDRLYTGGDGSDNYYFTVPSAPTGTYCVTGTDDAGDNEGTVCNSVS